MKPVMQLSVDGEKGDCFRACMASMLELPNSTDLPHIESEMWPLEWERFLDRFGMGYGHDAKAIWRQGYWIASVPSLNFENGGHAIVMLGSEVAHDPSTKKRYETGRHLGGYDLVNWGWWLEVSDVSKLHLLDEYRRSLLTA